MRRPFPVHAPFVWATLLVILLASGCMRDPDIAKITCRNNDGCPAGYACAATGLCCQSRNGLSCDGADATLADGAGSVPVDSTVADAPIRLDGTAIDDFGSVSEVGIPADGSTVEANDASRDVASGLDSAGAGGTAGLDAGDPHADAPMGSGDGTGGVAGTGGSIVGTSGGGGAAGAGGVTGAGGPDVPLDAPIGGGDGGGTTATGGATSTGGIGLDGATVTGGAIGAGGQDAPGDAPIGGGSGGGTTATGGAISTGGIGLGGTSVAGGTNGTGGTTGTGGATGTGGTTGMGGASGTGGSTPSGCTPACTAGQDCIGGACVPSPWYGTPCTTTQDCPANSTCKDGSDESYDGTRLPPGDGTYVDSHGSSQYVVSGDQLSVTDTITGLVWQRDSPDSPTGCGVNDNPAWCTWAEAQDYCKSLGLGGMSDWRLPARMELLTIADYTNPQIAIDSTAFLNAVYEMRWTSSPYAPSSASFAWLIYFGDGSSSSDGNLYSGSRLRCVRGSRCYPTNRFVVLDGGLVRDTLTKLVWQQQASDKTVTWPDAQTFCAPAGADFRLPTVKELLSLVDLRVTPGPTVNQAAFPSTPPELFWTSSPSAGSSGSAWTVNFSDGNVAKADQGNSYRVRCVR